MLLCWFSPKCRKHTEGERLRVLISYLSRQYSDPYLSPTVPTLPLPSVSLIGVLLAYQYTHLASLNLTAILAFSLLSTLHPTNPLPLPGSTTPPQLSGHQSAFYQHLLLINPVLQQLWPPLITATCNFPFWIDWFPQSPCLTTCIIKITFLFQS